MDIKERNKILIIDDNKGYCTFVTHLLDKNGYLAKAFHEPSKALDALKSEFFGLVLLDLRIGDIDGIGVLKQIKDINQNIVVIMISAHTTVKSAVEAIKLGAYDYLTKEIEEEEFLLKIKRALEKVQSDIKIHNLENALAEKYDFCNIVGKNEKMQQIYKLIEDVSQADMPILIRGETGTGKELIAKAIHFNSKKKEGPFIDVNCAAISETLMESEVFGHEKGAYTGAYQQKLGKIEIANDGTLFLDEIGDMSFHLQAKLLRFLEDKSFERVGGITKIYSNARIISATNKNLAEEIRKGKFRQDLYYRINAVQIEIPPLRERQEDIQPLIQEFIKIGNKEFSKDVENISKEGLCILASYNWPGNVRELKNLIFKLILISKDKIIQESNIVEALNLSAASDQINSVDYTKPLNEVIKLKESEIEKDYLEKLLEKYKGRINDVAKHSGVDRKTIYLKMEKYKFNKEDYK